MDTCKHCGKQVLTYSHTHTSDGEILCNDCSRYLFELAKDVTLTYGEYALLADEDKQYEEGKEIYLYKLLQSMYQSEGDEVSPDELRALVSIVVDNEEQLCKDTLNKVRNVITKKERSIMFNVLVPPHDKWREDIEGKHHFVIEKEYDKIINSQNR